MSTETIQKVIEDLQSLRPGEQDLVLNFLAALKRHTSPATPSQVAASPASALAYRDGLLVFTGTIEAPETDWLARERAEREAELLRRVAPSE
jgi:hypothetical protein